MAARFAAAVQAAVVDEQARRDRAQLWWTSESAERFAVAVEATAASQKNDDESETTGAVHRIFDMGLREQGEPTGNAYAADAARSAGMFSAAAMFWASCASAGTREAERCPQQ